MSSVNALPSAWWFMRMGWKPAYRGTDEWGRHTLVVGLSFLWGIVIPYKWCTCDDMQDFTCPWYACRAQGIFPGAPCPSHDPCWNRDP